MFLQSVKFVLLKILVKYWSGGNKYWIIGANIDRLAVTQPNPLIEDKQEKSSNKGAHLLFDITINKFIHCYILYENKMIHLLHQLLH